MIDFFYTVRRSCFNWLDKPAPICDSKVGIDNKTLGSANTLLQTHIY